MNIQAKLTKISSYEQEIFNYFGYEPEWRDIKLSDETEMYWGLVGSNNIVAYAAVPFSEEIIDVGMEFYTGHTGGNIYEKDNYTALRVDT